MVHMRNRRVLVDSAWGLLTTFRNRAFQIFRHRPFRSSPVFLCRIPLALGRSVAQEVDQSQIQMDFSGHSSGFSSLGEIVSQLVSVVFCSQCCQT